MFKRWAVIGLAMLVLGDRRMRRFQQETEKREAAEARAKAAEAEIARLKAASPVADAPKASQNSLQARLLGRWKGSASGLLASSESLYTFAADGTFHEDDVVDFGWPQGKKPVSIFGTYEVLSENQLKFLPNGAPVPVHRTASRSHVC